MNGASIKRDPRFLWFWRLLAPVVAAYLFADAKLKLKTSTVTLRGAGAGYSCAAVYVNWHQHLPFLCTHNGLYKRWLLMSSAPYLEPIAMWCRWMGLTVVRSAPGERSRESLGHLADALKRGSSVALAADGPAGPGFRVKPGCVDLARAAGVPIVPLWCKSQKGRSDSSRWDRLYAVGMFDQIEVWYGAPIILDSSESDEAALERVQKGLEESLGHYA